MYKNILSSTLPLVFSILLFVIVGDYGIGRVQSLRSQIAQTQKDKTVLTDKLNILRDVDATIETGSQASSVALPQKNSVFLVVSQIRSIAQQNAMVLSDLRSGIEVKDASGFSTVDLNFSVAGPEPGMSTFLDGITKIAPIALVDKVKLDDTTGVTQAAVTLKSFWAPFPQSLPALTDQIYSLTPDEKTTLAKVSSLVQPQFVTVPPSNTGGRTDPFAQQ